MGRKRIQIEKIGNERTRQVTFYKRKKGLIKKAMEIALLCQIKVMLCIVDKNEKCIMYSSDDPETFIQKYINKKIGSRTYLQTRDYGNYLKREKAKKIEIQTPIPLIENQNLLPKVEEKPVVNPKKNLFKTTRVNTDQEMKATQTQDLKRISSQQAVAKPIIFNSIPLSDEKYVDIYPLNEIPQAREIQAKLPESQVSNESSLLALIQSNQKSEHEVIAQNNIKEKGARSEEVSKMKEQITICKAKFRKLITLGRKVKREGEMATKKESNYENNNKIQTNLTEKTNNTPQLSFQNLSGSPNDLDLLFNLLQSNNSTGLSASQSYSTCSTPSLYPVFFSPNLLSMNMTSNLNPIKQLNQYTENQFQPLNSQVFQCPQNQPNDPMSFGFMNYSQMLNKNFNPLITPLASPVIRNQERIQQIKDWSGLL